MIPSPNACGYLSPLPRPCPCMIVVYRGASWACLTFTKSHTSLQWPSCPPPLSSLSIDDVFFGVMTARRLLSSRARVVSRTLALQGARHALFGDEDLNNATLGYMTQLPESAKLEHWNGGGRRPPFVAQKVSQWESSILIRPTSPACCAETET